MSEVDEILAILKDEDNHTYADWTPELNAEATAEALRAYVQRMKAEAFEQGQKSGMRHAERITAAAKIGRPDLPGPLSPNPYR